VKSIVRYFLLIALCGIVISDVLLRNFTAPNPTGRRYSSEMPLTTRQGSSTEIGRSGEAVLGKDLRLPNNNDAGQRQCICSNAAQSKPTPCFVCLANLSEMSRDHRIPDFVGSGFIAESKNEQGLLYSGREVDQLNDYALAARMMRARLWVYVRVDTDVAPEFIRLAEVTGGGVVRYFVVPGYIDPIDRAAQTVFALSLSILATVGVGWLLSHRFKKLRQVVSSPSPKPPRPPKQSPDPATKAIRKADAAEDFAQRSKEKRRQDIDIDDSRDDLL
jgi:hypothetical protein